MLEKIRELEEKIREWEYHYRILDNPIVSDAVYDYAFKELQKLAAEYPEHISENSPVHRIGNTLIDGFKKVKHKHVMGSIENTYNHDELIAWDIKLSEKLGCKANSLRYTLEDKFDGISGSIHYKHGKLEYAATRGDGETGDDITNNVKAVINVPKELKIWYLTCEVRGEFVIFKNQLDIINKKENSDYKNVRNLVSGTMKSLDSSVVRNRNVIFIPYYLYDKDGKELSFDDGNIGSSVFSLFWQNAYPPIVNYGGNIEEIIQLLKEIENKDDYKYHKNRKWLVDGAVIKVTDFNLREQLGYVSNCPVWAKAYKFEQEKAITTVKSITWQVGRDRITPVAELEPVELEGTTVSRATIHNVTQLKRLRVTNGCKVEIEKAGFIIPYINKVVEDDGILQIVIPRTCPECNAETAIIKKESEILTCTNENCPAKLVNKTLYMINALDIEEIGESFVTELVSKNMIKNQYDLFLLSYDDIMTMDRMGTRKADKIYHNLQKAIIQPLYKVIQSLGISDVGESNSEKIANKVECLDNFVSADVNTLTNIENIGETTAKNILDFLDKNKEIINQIKQIFVIRKNEGFTNLLSGKKFVITGAATKSRDELVSIIKKNGGDVSGSVSKKTDYVIIGSKEPADYKSSKKTKAIELNIPIHDEFWLLEQLGMKEERKEESTEKEITLNDLF